MPAKLERCVSDVKGDGKSSDSAWGICTDSLKKEAVSIPNDLSDIEKPTQENILKQILETKLNGCGCNKR